MSFDGKAFGAEVVSAVKDYLERNLSSVVARLNSIELRLAELESGGVRFAGVWQRALRYGKGSTVTADGALWIALKDTSAGEKPGEVPAAWQLCVKSARSNARTNVKGMPQ